MGRALGCEMGMRMGWKCQGQNINGDMWPLDISLDPSLLCFWSLGALPVKAVGPALLHCPYWTLFSVGRRDFGLRHCSDFTKSFTVPENSGHR